MRFGEHEKILSGSEAETTNNRMELQAVISGLSSLKEVCEVHLYVDSRYVMDAFEKGWMKAWKSNGWKTAGGKKVKNQDLWVQLLKLVEKHDIRWHWVKGHSGDPDNEAVDEAARLKAIQLIEKSQLLE